MYFFQYHLLHALSKYTTQTHVRFSGVKWKEHFLSKKPEREVFLSKSSLDAFVGLLLHGDGLFTPI